MSIKIRNKINKFLDLKNEWNDLNKMYDELFLPIYQKNTDILDFLFEDENALKLVKQELNLIRKIDGISNKMSKIVKNDKILFEMYNSICDMIIIEEYELASEMKNRIIDYECCLNS